MKIFGHDVTGHEMLVDDAPGSGFIDMRVPDVIRVHGNDGAMATLIHASGMVNAHGCAQRTGCDVLFEQCVDLERAGKRAGFPAGTHKYVITVLTH